MDTSGLNEKNFTIKRIKESTTRDDLHIIADRAVFSGDIKLFSNLFRLNNPIVLSTDVDVFNEEIKVYPNPVSKEVSISGSDNIDRIEIYDALGRKVYKSAFNRTIKVDDFNP